MKLRNILSSLMIFFAFIVLYIIAGSFYRQYASDWTTIINKSDEPIKEVKVHFGWDDPSSDINDTSEVTLVFKNVAPHSQQWQRSERTWGNMDSSMRMLSAEGTTSSGKKLGPASPSRDIQVNGPDRVIVTLEPHGSFHIKY
jgi:hypothetical protein